MLVDGKGGLAASHEEEPVDHSDGEEKQTASKRFENDKDERGSVTFQFTTGRRPRG